MSTRTDKFLAVCCITLVLAGCDRGKAEQADINRYTIVHSPHIERDTQLLDTATGDTWVFVQIEGTDKYPEYSWQFVGKIGGPPNPNEAARVAQPAPPPVPGGPDGATPKVP